MKQTLASILILSFAVTCLGQYYKPLSLEETPQPIVAKLKTLHDEILNLKNRFKELSEYGDYNRSGNGPILSYRYDLRSVLHPYKKMTYYEICNLRCYITVQVFRPSETAGALVNDDPIYTDGKISLEEGYFLFYRLGTKNADLRDTLSSTIKLIFEQGLNDSKSEI